MALLRRRTDERDVAVDDRPVDEHGERAGTSPGLVRALFTLAGVAGAGVLLWLAQLFNLDATSGFWVAAGLMAAAGAALGLSQLFGGWTKWGWPTMSPMMFLLAFLPTLVVGGLMLLAWQPTGGWGQATANDWISGLGLGGLLDALAPFLWVVPLVIGLVFSFTFDTTGPRTHIVDRDAVRDERVVRHERGVPDEDVHDYRRDREDETVAGELRRRETVAEPAEPVGERRTTEVPSERTDVPRDRDRI